MAPRRFVSLPKPAVKPAGPTAQKTNGETGMGRGARRALWLIALATLVNAAVAALQWYEIHTAYGSGKQAANASAVSRTVLEP
jgi:hypothetical protein